MAEAVPLDRTTRTLAQFFTETAYGAIPANAIHEVRRAIVDGLAVGLGGADHPSADLLLAYSRTLGDRPEAQVWGRADRLPAELAALVNGQQEHVLDYDDTYLPAETVLHATVPLLPALLAVAEARGLSGKQVLRSFVLGFEMEARLALALGRQHYLAGWHVTATTGPVGSAVAVGTLIGLNAKQLCDAIGIAVTHSGGVTAMLGSMSKAYHTGKAAEAGVRSALLAELGFDGPPEPLTHPQGYVNVASSDKAMHWFTQDLGREFLIVRNGYKPYASGVVSHPVIDALIQMRGEGLKPDDIARIDAKVDPFVLQVMGNKEPSTGLEGKFSTYHCAAVALLDGAAAKAQFTDARVNDPAAVALRRKVTLLPDDSIRKGECTVIVTLKNGETREQYIPYATGTGENPMTDGQMSAKFRQLAEPIIGGRADKVLAQAWALEEVSDLAEFARLLSA